MPKPAQQQLQSLRDGAFLNRRENVLVFGKPGSGKTHALCALGEQLILQGRSVYFATCSLLVQDLLVAKRDLKLERFLKKLAGFDANAGGQWQRILPAAMIHIHKIDADGALARTGTVNEAALRTLLTHAYFGAGIPKSLDRNAFSAAPVAALSPASSTPMT